MENRIELLAPAGSYESFRAALGAGADAVYAGGDLFGARAFAHNFDGEELIRAIREAHVQNRKLYLTVNTLLKNVEIEKRLFEYLKPFYEEGLDAVLVQDFGVLSFIREYFPELPVHASTQMTVTGPEGMKFLEKFGVTRVVPARELSLDELTQMHSASSLELETFIHGALCYCYSGRCLMSSLFGGRSGNRGKCAQPCRLPFNAGTRKNEACLLSMKDLSGADLIPELISAGIASLKIEGRMKQPDYVAGVTGVYRSCIDRFYIEGSEHYSVREEERRLLKDLFNRGGFTQGYYHQHNGKSMVSFRNEKKTVPTDVSVNPPKRSVTASAKLFKGSPAELTLSAGDTECTITGCIVQQAESMPLTEERIREQLLKMGSTPFAVKNLEIRMDPDIFLPMKDLNSLRRTASEQLEALLADSFRRDRPVIPGTQNRRSETLIKSQGEREESPVRFHLSCLNLDTALGLAETGLPEIGSFYLPFDIMEVFMEKGYQERYHLYLSLPEIVRGSFPDKWIKKAEQWLQDGMHGFLVKDLEGLAFLSGRNSSGHFVTDASLYTWNDRAVGFFLEQGAERITAPVELNEKELSHRNSEKGEIMIYGYQPLMVSAQCVKKNTSACNGRGEVLRMTDRTRREFPVLCVCDPWETGNTPAGTCCYNIIYNSLPLGLFKEAEKVLKAGFRNLRMEFTLESPQEAVRLLSEARTCFTYGKAPEGLTGLTGGHFNRGAE